jgi:hypothetical protein
VFSYHLNPFYLRGDFDADGKVDYASMIKNRIHGKCGIAICLSSKKQVFIIGAGKILGNGDDFIWIDIWMVSVRLSKYKSHWEDRELNMVAEGIMIDKSESSTAMIYWDGTEFKWYQISD